MLSEVASGLGMEAPVAFRINPDVEAGTHAKISTGAAYNKFGIALDTAPEAYAVARALPGLKVQGVAVHIGSQLTDLAPLEAAFHKLGRLLADLRSAGHAITHADLGGGLGVPYDRALPMPPTPEAYGAMVVLGLCAIIVAVLTFIEAHPPETSLIGSLAAIAFALPVLRNALPGSPPLGVPADMWVFLWAELATVAALALVVFKWARAALRA